MGDKEQLKKRYKVVIMGSGPAGLTAALYSARANLEPLVFEGFEAGGQLTLTTDVENYPGFENGIMGPDLINTMRKQAERFGAKCLLENIDSVDLSKRPFKINAGDTEVEADSFIVASGASARMLGLPSEKELVGHGVSTCATCDGFFFKDKEIIVVGGGDSALEEGIFLTKFASKVYIVHRRDALRASKIMQDRAFKNEKVEFIWNSVVEEILGEKGKGVTGVKLENVQSGEITEMNIDGVFIAIGHIPNTKIFGGAIETDENGYIVTKDKTSETNVPGVFAAGDVQDTRYKQAITAAGSGCMAALDAEKFLEDNED
ncbi:MAG: thioredoxin-disulfide reductase [Candidatus Dadabacteria bacterium]|nr:thioredoxin-disulfide reductase [Candidatus Dadabacteria bacterium]NIS09095.1 thioredoxin-disulfide reductase [Candidatus Dadabacteria bacterium]NIV41531.1 thioredoxin-disulfide reductase [Candidatus Dadabacteria bacterium]NIX15212.1 thioredoxin-disulfide reductase [Candidatus Dadabacteria bacterium]NIY21856.1 thioredoxin-disulfide reductase [Candidatus Dadabacteria bacterium]